MIKTLSGINPALKPAILKPVGLILIGLTLLSGNNSFAQLAEESGVSAVTTEKTTERTEKETNHGQVPSNEKADPGITKKHKQDKLPDIFVPSEEISEDLSVSFPEDI